MIVSQSKSTDNGRGDDAVYPDAVCLSTFYTRQLMHDFMCIIDNKTISWPKRQRRVCKMVPGNCCGSNEWNANHCLFRKQNV